MYFYFYVYYGYCGIVASSQSQRSEDAAYFLSLLMIILYIMSSIDI